MDSGGYKALTDPLGKLMSTAMTTFFSMPSARTLSMALQTFFHGTSNTYTLAAHPKPRYQNAEMQILSTLGKVPGKTKLSMRLVKGGSQHMVRVDVVDMTRHVHHHFDYKRDGHNRKYNMHVVRNETMTATAVELRKTNTHMVGDAYRKTGKGCVICSITVERLEETAANIFKPKLSPTTF